MRIDFIPPAGVVYAFPIHFPFKIKSTCPEYPAKEELLFKITYMPFLPFNKSAIF